jgi:hypothetical protein
MKTNSPPNLWAFGPPIDAPNWSLPSRRQHLLYNGVPVGEIEVHCHQRRGADGITDLSWGVTAITYGPLSRIGEPITRPPTDLYDANPLAPTPAVPSPP